MLRDAVLRAKTRAARSTTMNAAKSPNRRSMVAPMWYGPAMKTIVTICVLGVMMAAAAALMPNPGWKPLHGGSLHAGLVMEADNVSPSAVDNAKTCEHVAFTRSIKYGEADRNVLDVAAADASDGTPRPVLLFVAGDSFSSEDTQADAGMSLLQR